MGQTAGRTLELLSLLQTVNRWSGPALAARLGISLRTLRRDIDTLRDLGYTVDASGGRDSTYRLAAGSNLPRSYSMASRPWPSRWRCRLPPRPSSGSAMLPIAR